MEILEESVAKAYSEDKSEDILTGLTTKQHEILDQLLERFDHEKNSSGLTKVKEHLAGMSPMHVTVAFEPDIKFTDKVVNLIEDATAVEVYLDMIVDPTILGGVILEYNGKHINKSVENLFDLSNEF